MKKLYRTLIKGTNWALAGLLTLLGFSGITSCDTKEEYGSPHATYSIKGAVTDEAGKPIKNIGIKGRFDLEKEYDLISTKTNTEGKFDITYSEFPNNEFYVIAEDIDGVENGLFKSDTTHVVFEEADFVEKGKGWYHGAASKEISIQLKESKE